VARLAPLARHGPQAPWESRSLPGLIQSRWATSGFSFVCARHGAQRRGWRCQPIAKANREVTWRCKSSGDLGDRNPEPNGNCDVVMRRGKEAAGKTPARGVRTADEAQRWWARGHNDSKPDVIRTGGAYMRRVDGANVTRLTLGDLLACLAASRIARCGRCVSRSQPRPS
jgi:hypothetical protein